MTTSPTTTVTAAAVLQHLIGIEELTRKDLISILGTQRSRVDLNTLSLALVASGVISEERLAAVIGSLSGKPLLDGSGLGVLSLLDAGAANKYGALIVDREPLTVAFIEDTPENIAGVSDSLGVEGFDIFLVTAPAFARYRDSLYSGKNYLDRENARDLSEILDNAIDNDASDVHISVGVPPRIRASGLLVETRYQPTDRKWMSEQISELLSERNQEELRTHFSTDLGYTFGTARFRVNVAKDSRGHTMALRRLPNTIPTPDDVGLPPAVRSFTEHERGLVLITGATGSGKSTTLAALLNQIVTQSARHVITLEDPIEFRFPENKKSLVNQRELGTSFHHFADGLRDALRQDPDVILVGELRDEETIHTAITAAETGHLVFATLHTYDAPSTIMRLVNSYPASEQDSVRSRLASLLRGVVSQTLVPRVSGKGRVAAHEIMINTVPIAANLRKHDGHSSLRQTIQTSSATGMITMEASLARLVTTGMVSRGEAEFRARDREDFQRMLEYYTATETKLRSHDIR
jgi:twitching motility protein PilT